MRDYEKPTIETLPQKGSHLADLRLVRNADGTISMTVIVMDSGLIETTGEEVPDRLRIIADWALEGAANMAEQFPLSCSGGSDNA